MIHTAEHTTVKYLQLTKSLCLETGGTLTNPVIAYTTFGSLNEKKDNVIWVCHALTANANPIEWWPGLIGENCLINPGNHFIVCANILGSCYGTTGPLEKNPDTGTAYFRSFPFITVRDMVQAHIELANALGIHEVKLLIGGSLGGQQVLEWSIIEPQRIKQQVLIATNAFHSPYGIAFNESQRLAVFADETYHRDIENGGAAGLKAARSIALISYRTYGAYNETQKEETCDKVQEFKSAGYQNYQGEKLVNRFNAYAYVTLSKTMDSHNVGRNRGGVENALKNIRAKTLVIGVSSDILFPVSEQKYLAQNIPGAVYNEIDSFYGHDGFLIETKKITASILNNIQL